MSVRFDDFEVDRERYELRRDGQVIALEPLVFDLLLYFIDHRDRVVSRDQLIETVWRGRIVSDATIAGAVKSLRRALGDSGETQNYLQTLRGRGFRFCAEIRDGAPARSVVREPALAVLPVTLADGMDSWRDLAIDLVEDLQRILTRIPLLRIGTGPAPGETDASDSPASPSRLYRVVDDQSPTTTPVPVRTRSSASVPETTSGMRSLLRSTKIGE